MRKLITVVLAVLVLTGVFYAGIEFGSHPGLLPSGLRGHLVGKRGSFDQALDVIDDSYYRSVSEQALLDVSLKSMVESLDDRFSTYLSPRMYNEFQQQSSGKFEGIGVTVHTGKSGLQIVRVLPGSPAARARLRSRDVIISVNGDSIRGMPSEVSTARIKGPAGTAVRITVRTSDNKTRSLILRRARVEAPVVTSRTLSRRGKKIGYVRLEGFTADCHKLVDRSVRAHLSKRVKGIIFDLRQNTGGYLREAVAITSLFIKKGVVVTTSGRSEPRTTFKATGKVTSEKIPLVVVVDHMSASASEVVTGALQDYRRATIVGERTFGKGVFQRPTPLPNGGALYLTTGQYFTPKGRNLGITRKGKKPGVEPDIKVSNARGPKSRDAQLESALQVFERP